MQTLEGGSVRIPAAIHFHHQLRERRQKEMWVSARSESSSVWNSDCRLCLEGADEGVIPLSIKNVINGMAQTSAGAPLFLRGFQESQ